MVTFKKIIFLGTVLCFSMQGLVAMNRGSSLRGLNPFKKSVGFTASHLNFFPSSRISSNFLFSLLQTQYPRLLTSKFASETKSPGDTNQKSRILPIMVLATAIGGSYLIKKSIYAKTANDPIHVEKKEKQNNHKKTTDPVRIVHNIGRGGNIKSVRQYGLLSFNEMHRRGLTTTDPSTIRGLMQNQYDIVYFAYQPESNYTKNCVYLEVDPNSTYVYNREFRYYNQNSSYLGSRVLLSTYIANKEKANKMRENAEPGQWVIFDPFTSEPFYVNYNDRRLNNNNETLLGELPGIPSSCYKYLGEIIFEKDSIPPHELIFPD